MTSTDTIPSSFLLTLKTGSHQPKLNKKKQKKHWPNLYFISSIFRQSLPKLWQNDRSRKKYDILVPSLCINVLLGKCRVTNFPKINIELRGFDILWLFLLFCQIFMARTVDYYHQKVNIRVAEQLKSEDHKKLGN